MHMPALPKFEIQVYRVLRPGGRFYAEEPVAGFLNHPLMHRLFAHPVEDRFEASDFRTALGEVGLIVSGEEQIWRTMCWFVATKPA